MIDKGGWLSLLVAALPLSGGGGPRVVSTVLREGDAPLVLFEQQGRLFHLMEVGSWQSAAVRRVALERADFPEGQLLSRFRRGDGSPPEPLSWNWPGGTRVVAFGSTVFRAELEECVENGYERRLCAIYPVRPPDPPRRPRLAGEPLSFEQCTPPSRLRSFLFVSWDPAGSRPRSMVVPVPSARTPERERRTLGANGAGNVTDGWTGSFLSGRAAEQPDGSTCFEPVPLRPRALELLAHRLSAPDLAALRSARFTGWRFDPAGQELVLLAEGLELRMRHAP